MKAAGVPIDLLFEPGAVFVGQSTPDVAVEMAETFHQLRYAPPQELRDRIFPRSDETKGQFRSGALLTRPILKTDQGAGQFLSFGVGGMDKKLRFEIAQQSGYSIEESFFTEQLKRVGYPDDVISELRQVRSYYQEGDLREAQLAYERMQIAAQKHGIITEREAGVGRDALFFIRPSLPVERIQIPSHSLENVVSVVSEQMERFADMAQRARDVFCTTHRIRQATNQYNAPLYFQADVQLMPDGSAVLDQIHLPDVGLFLTTLDPMGNPAFAAVQEANAPLAHQVADAISRHTYEFGNDRIYVVTRDEVLERGEDILEQREILALTRLLRDREVDVVSVGIQSALSLSSSETALLLNVDTHTPGYTALLRHHLTGNGADLYPDPFLKLAIDEMTGYKQVMMSEAQVESLRSIVGGVSAKGKKEDVFRATLALDTYLRRIGITEDVFHIHISSQSTPVACYRYDIRGMQIAMGYARRGDRIVARNIPVNPDRAVLFHAGRPTHTVFRFMVTQEGI